MRLVHIYLYMYVCVLYIFTWHAAPLCSELDRLFVCVRVFHIMHAMQTGHFYYYYYCCFSVAGETKKRRKKKKKNDEAVIMSTFHIPFIQAWCLIHIFTRGKNKTHS